LLAWSDKLVELKTICFCGRKASMVLRLDQAGKPYADGEQVVIGAMNAMFRSAVSIIKKRCL
jgi:thymidine kinase